MPYINEACFVLYEGIATATDIDKGMKLGTNTPMGYTLYILFEFFLKFVNKL